MKNLHRLALAAAIVAGGVGMSSTSVCAAAPAGVGPGMGAGGATAPAASSSGELNATELLPMPVAPTSREGKEELATVHRLEAERTDADVARIQAENNLSLDTFADIAGPWLTQEKCPRLYTMLTNIDLAVNSYNNSLKPVFDRPRPEAVDPTLKTVFHETDGSYPSGHSVRATVYALLLSQICPDLKDKLIQRSQQIGWDRVMAGMHFPSDVFAGRVLGQALAHVILSDPRVQGQMAALKAEVAAARAGK